MHFGLLIGDGWTSIVSELRCRDEISGKQSIKLTPGYTVPIIPKFLFTAIRDRGVVDVFDIGTSERVRVIELSGQPAVLSSYWRQ